MEEHVLSMKEALSLTPALNLIIHDKIKSFTFSYESIKRKKTMVMSAAN